MGSATVPVAVFGVAPLLLKIARPFMAGMRVPSIFQSPVRDGRQFLSSLTGLEAFPNHEPSLERLGYCQREGKLRAANPSVKTPGYCQNPGGDEGGKCVAP